jgi:hypothetical protein
MTARAAFHTGEIVSLMYAGEDYLTKFIRELSFTYRLTYKMELEAGIFPAIYGAETFINKDNLHASRAVMTDFAPDFETGIRLKYKYSRYWRATFQITNGWQAIKENNHSPGFGMVHIYDKPNKFLFNYGIFVGNEVYQSKNALDQFKFYNNLFARIHVGKRWIVAPMVDIGMMRNPVTQAMDQWQAYGGSVRYALTPEWGIAARYERLRDLVRLAPRLADAAPRDGALVPPRAEGDDERLPRVRPLDDRVGPRAGDPKPLLLLILNQL